MVRLKQSILVILAIFLWSCVSPVEEPPADLIPTEKLKMILLDFHLSESYVDVHFEGKDTANVVFNALEKQVLEKHGVTKDNYLSSYNYYLRNTEELDDIYEQVVKELSKMESRAKAGKQEEAPTEKKK